MTTPRASLLILIAALTAAPAAWASDEAPVATGHTPTVSEQIDAYLKSSPPVDLEDGGVDGVTPGRPDRQAHGVAEVSVGTGGYRSVYLRSDMPVGKTGTLSIAVEHSRSNHGLGGYGYGYGGYGPNSYRGLNVGLALGDAGPPAVRCHRSPYSVAEAVDIAPAGRRCGLWPDN